MSSRNYTLTFSSAGTLTAPGGRFFYLKAASAALTITARGATTQPIVLEDLAAGTKFGPVPLELRWTYLDVTSAVAQVVTIFVSDDAEVDIASTVNVAGNVTTSEMPSTTIATPARVSVGSGAEVLLIAQNLARKRLLVQAVDANTAIVTIGPTGGVSSTRGIELPAGASVPLPTLAAVYAIAVSGTQSVQVLEET